MSRYSHTAGRDDWLNKLTSLASETDQCVLVTMVQTRGSVPREAGCKMLVLHDDCVGTIGGGHLEYKVIQQARELLDSGNPDSQRLVKLPLGASLGQCCGGYVELMLERLSRSSALWLEPMLRLRGADTRALLVTALPAKVSDEDSENNPLKLVVTEHEVFGTLGSDRFLKGSNTYLRQRAIESARSLLQTGQPLYTQLQGNLLFEPISTNRFQVFLFGAGHVGQALIRVLQMLPCYVTWIDSRPDMFPKQLLHSNNIQQVVSDEPALEIDEAPAGCFVLVMTHHHQLDYEICERTMHRSDIAFCGLIGSKTKRQRFLSRMKKRGNPPEILKRLSCPIGVHGLNNKHPADIAIGTAAQLLQLVGKNSIDSESTLQMGFDQTIEINH